MQEEEEEEEEEEEQQQGLEFPCPSFDSYSVNRFAEAAARVTRNEEEEESDDFEFVSLRETGERGCGVFLDSPIGTVFPIFNKEVKNQAIDGEESFPTIRFPLEKLLIRDRDPSSTSEADELDGAQPGTYCYWTPKNDETVRGRCKKSKSTGSSSKRWSLREFLRRSNSEGNNSAGFAFLMASSSRSNSLKKQTKEEKDDVKDLKKEKISEDPKSKITAGRLAGRGKGVVAGGDRSSSANELFYVRGRRLKEEEKRKSFLPYRQDLVGFWANFSTFGRTFPPF